jgi:hypothetical protein
MAKRLAIPSKETQVKIVGPIDSFVTSRVQRVQFNDDVPSNYIDQLGSTAHAGTSKGIPNVSISISIMDVGIRVFSVLTGTDPSAYPGAGVDISNLTEVDVIVYIKDATLSDYVKSAHCRRLQVRDFTFNYSVEADSTEDYNLVGSEKRWFKNDVVVDKFTTGTTSFTLADTPIQLANGNKLLSVVLDGAYLTEVASGPSTGEYSVSGTTLTTGDSRTAQVLAVYHANPAGNNWSDVSDTVQAVAIPGKDVAIEINANSIPRVQSVTINGALQPQEVREMGNRNMVGYQRQNATVEGTLSVLDTDTELIDLLLNGTINSGATEFQIGQGCVLSGVDLEIILRDPCDTTSPYDVKKTVYVPDIEIVGESWQSNVNNNAVTNFNWRGIDGLLYVYSGAKA